MNMLDDVRQFHQKFNMPKRVWGEVFKKDVVLFRLSFLLEELQELSSALNNDDFEQATDALVDLVYVALGTADILSLPFPAAWEEVHKANMQKVAVASSKESKRGSQLDIGKPAGWEPPDILQFLSLEDHALQDELHYKMANT